MHLHAQSHALTEAPRAPPDAAGGSPRQGLIRSSRKELGRELPLNCRERGRTRLPLAYQTSQAAALVRTGVLYFYHTRGSSHAARLSKAEAAFYYSGQSSVSGLREIRFQDQMLVSVRHGSSRRAREFCLYRDRFVPRFPQGELHSTLWKP